MCQRTNHRLDVIKQKLDANSYNHKLIHSKLQIKEPLKEVSDGEDDLPEPIILLPTLLWTSLPTLRWATPILRGTGGGDSGNSDYIDDAIFLFFSLFGALMPKGEKKYLSCFHLIVLVGFGL
jgi:hypothetical protein